MKAAIFAKQLTFSYMPGHAPLVLDEVDITVNKGEFVAILGQNGCGKSTLARHFNALLPLQQGTLTVAGFNTGDAHTVWPLRKICGMVFQNPENQFVSAVLDEDLAFGPENYAMPASLIPGKIKEVLHQVGLDGYEKRAPHTLSGGQQQRAALAGILILEPEIIVFDEVTSMLDPEGRQEVLAMIQKLHREAGKTIVMITHYVEEAVMADYILLMQQGKRLAYGTPHTILTDEHLMAAAGMIPPMPVRLYHDLKRAGIALPNCPLTHEELVEALCRLN